MVTVVAVENLVHFEDLNSKALVEVIAGRDTRSMLPAFRMSLSEQFGLQHPL